MAVRLEHANLTVRDIEAMIPKHGLKVRCVRSQGVL